MMKKRGFAAGAVAGMALVVALPLASFGQSSTYHDQMAKKIAEKQETIRRHTKEMERISDPERLSVEMRKHFQMTEDLMALMVEHRRLLGAQTPRKGVTKKAVPPAVGEPTTGGAMSQGKSPGSGMSEPMGEMRGGMQMGRGGMMEGMHGMMEGGREMGTGTGGGMSGPTGSMAGPSSGGQPDPMAGMAQQAQPPSAGAQTSAPPSAQEMEVMMKKITDHSIYLETIQDRETLAREMVKHQQMLDRMMQMLVQ